jgi:hypothetical protein
MAKLWASFFPYIQPYVPGCPEIVITAHLQETAAKFLARSEIWRFDIEQDFTSKATSDYEIDVPALSVLENVLTLYVDDCEIKAVSDRYVDRVSTATQSRPMYYSIYQDTQIRFFPTPDKKYTFEGKGVLKTSLSATGVEDWIFETYGRCISYGAIALIAGIPGKEWSNPDLAVYYQMKFDKDADDAKSRDTRRVNLRTAPVGFDRASGYRRSY